MKQVLIAVTVILIYAKVQAAVYVHNTSILKQTAATPTKASKKKMPPKEVKKPKSTSPSIPVESNEAPLDRIMANIVSSSSITL